MTEAEELQYRYYTETAARYDDMHLDPEHAVALRYIGGLIEMLRISSILDVGCGTGRGLGWLLRNRRLSAYGIEPVAALLSQGVRGGTLPSACVAVGRGESLPFADGAFDAACSFAVLHHVREPNAVVREMTRVARRAIFISDSNRFGQGSDPARLLKLLLSMVKLWGVANFIKTRGRGYLVSDGDGLAYSYSVFDSYPVLAEWADRVILVPTAPASGSHWHHPMLTSPSLLVCAVRE